MLLDWNQLAQSPLAQILGTLALYAGIVFGVHAQFGQPWTERIGIGLACFILGWVAATLVNRSGSA